MRNTTVMNVQSYRVLPILNDPESNGAENFLPDTN